jgi:hypothetical protein
MFFENYCWNGVFSSVQLAQSERGPLLHLSLIIEVTRDGRALEIVCSAWPDELSVHHVLVFTEGGRSGSHLRDFVYGYCAVRWFVVRLFGYAVCEVCVAF